MSAISIARDLGRQGYRMCPGSDHFVGGTDRKRIDLWALQILRVEPETAITKYGFIVDTEVYDHTWSGGPCKLECTMGSDSVYRLTAKSGVGDWFFPYCSMSMGGEVGTCMVPFNQPDGTIVTTGGMNGCSLQVNKFKGAFFFYHDLNGNSLKDAPGEVVCRIDYVDYAGTSGTGMQLAKNNTHSNKTTSVFSQEDPASLSGEKGTGTKLLLCRPQR